MTIIAVLLFLVLWAVSVAGLVVPVIPGVPLAAAAAVLAGWLTGFEKLGSTSLLVIIGLAVLAQVLDFVGGLLGTRYSGGSRAGMIGSVIGSIVGVIVAPPFGFLPGAFVGAVLFELLSSRPADAAWRSGVGALLGTLGGTFVKLLVLVAILIIALAGLF